MVIHGVEVGRQAVGIDDPSAKGAAAGQILTGRRIGVLEEDLIGRLRGCPAEGGRRHSRRMRFLTAAACRKSNGTEKKESRSPQQR